MKNLRLISIIIISGFLNGCCFLFGDCPEPPNLGVISIEGGNSATTDNILIFSVSIHNPSESPFTYSWDFGDGNTSTSATPGHKYENSGEYAVNVSVTNKGGTSEKTTRVKVSDPSASIYFWTQTPYNGSIRVDFYNSSALINAYYNQFPGCVRNQGNAEFRNIPYGTYYYQAISQSGKYWNGSIILNKQCNSLLLN